MDFQHLFYFVLASVALTLAPGPDILYLLAKSIADGAKSGVVFAAGLCSGLVVHTILVACGVAAVVSSSPALFHGLKYAGAAYLLYLAYRAWRESGELELAASSGEGPSLGALYRRGVLMNLLNPKVILFFLAFLPQFVDPALGGVSMQIVVLGTVFGVQALCVFSAAAILAGGIREKILSIAGLAAKMGAFQAVVLVGIAAVLLI